MRGAEVFLLTAVITTLWASFLALGWENCHDIGLFDQMCSKGSTENCVEICGGKPLPMKTGRVCTTKPKVIGKLGDSISGALACDLEHPLNGALYYDISVIPLHGPKVAASGELCNQYNLQQFCNTTKLRYIFKPYVIQDYWRLYVGPIRGRATFSDEDGTFLCFNFSSTLHD